MIIMFSYSSFTSTCLQIHVMSCKYCSSKILEIKNLKPIIECNKGLEGIEYSLSGTLPISTT